MNKTHYLIQQIQADMENPQEIDYGDIDYGDDE